MAVYVARLTPEGMAIVEVQSRHGNEPLSLRLDLATISRDGFDWGEYNAGAEQLALAMLAHAIDDEVARIYCRELAARVVQQLPLGGWRLTERWVRDWLHAITGPESWTDWEDNDWEEEAIVECLRHLGVPHSRPDRADDCWHLSA